MPVIAVCLSPARPIILIMYGTSIVMRTSTTTTIPITITSGPSRFLRIFSSLEEGEITLKVLFNDGKSAITRFTVSKSSNPNTGDHILLYVLIFGVSLIGIVGLIIYLIK